MIAIIDVDESQDFRDHLNLYLNLYGLRISYSKVEEAKHGRGHMEFTRSHITRSL